MLTVAGAFTRDRRSLTIYSNNVSKCRFVGIIFAEMK